MRNKKKIKWNSTPSNIISFRYAAIAFIIILILMMIIPKILNYGPGTINTPFDVQMSYISFNTQFLILGIVIVLGIVFFTKFALKDIDKWYKMSLTKRYSDKEQIKLIRKKCLTLPYQFYMFEILTPSIITILVLSLTGSHLSIMIAKIIILLASFSILLGVVSFIFSKNLYDEILTQTYIEGSDIGFRVSLRKRIMILVFPICIAAIILTALVGYSVSVIEKEDVLYSVYNKILTEKFDTEKVYTNAEIKEIANGFELYNDTDRVFILNQDKTYEMLKGEEISNFIVEYTIQISEQNNGRLYDSYGVDTQGSSIKLKTDTGNVYIGILYDIFSKTALNYLVLTALFLAAISAIIIAIFSSSISKSLRQIHKGFRNICNESGKEILLPVVSNDEIGDLVVAFNDIQKLNNAQIEDIHNKQNMLVERERLASLGQMVGGIAHSLKTPIFSISGGVAGLTDLVNEFDASIGNPQVNEQDMHEIASDMKVWLQKIKGQLSYMSEVITTVKGQAVNLSGDDTVDFTIKELFSHTNILMKHELQSALVTLNIKNDVSNDVILKGNINSLVQVLNNLISNAIQAYKKEPNKSIDLSAKLENNKILISVKDYGPGIPDNIKDKLFKEMITTKGKEGTGLGVFMSYSMIKAKFNGDIKLETSNKGTEFKIYLPMNN
ncbi:MAG: HAMP domain-containing histidine kinase [Clostridia bacterium]|nr:HAMP domain-containing histidine kinase [Clostridia bacterium]